MKISGTFTEKNHVNTENKKYVYRRGLFTASVVDIFLFYVETYLFYVETYLFSVETYFFLNNLIMLSLNIKAMNASRQIIERVIPATNP